MVVELTYGSIENQLTGGGSGGVPVDKASNRNNTLGAFPNLYPDAGVLNTSYYAYQGREGPDAADLGRQVD